MARLWPTPLVLGAAGIAAIVTNGGAFGSTESRITVTGPRDRIAQFVQREHARHPDVGVSTALVGDTTRAVITMPSTATGKELVTTLREALDAGLGYEVTARRSSFRLNWQR